MSEPEIICETRGAAGIATLNRPKALNALTHGMVRELAAALDGWERDPSVTRVVVRGAGGKAFCAGGDIRALYEAGRGGRIAEALAFWREEYALNIRIKRYPKPYVALLDGIVMGGGVGLSLHGSHRIAGDRFGFAMPEVGIGFFPDVGATYALPRLPGRTGTYLALTGARVGPGDGLALGLATHRVASADLPDLEAALSDGALLEQAFSAAPADAPGPVAANRAVIDRCFGEPDIAAILAALDRQGAAGSDFAAATAAAIRGKSPSSLALGLEQMRRGPDLGFEDAMRTEFRIVSRIAEGHDFYEGVRAVIIDKDGAPLWEPATPEGLAPDFLARHFAALPPDDELEVAR